MFGVKLWSKSLVLVLPKDKVTQCVILFD